VAEMKEEADIPLGMTKVIHGVGTIMLTVDFAHQVLKPLVIRMELSMSEVKRIKKH
jgi:hypothetical protein